MARATEESPPRRILLTGMFDMANYGDLLFPLIAHHHLAPAGFTVVPVAPTASEPGVAGAIPPLDITSVMRGAVPCDGILIGGGYVIHTHPITFIEDYDIGAAADWAGAGLWLGATLAAARQNVPVLWNAPGVMHPFRRSQVDLIAATLRAADYLAVRDEGAVELLDPPPDVRPHIVPDTVAGLASLWPRESLEGAFAHLLRRKSADTGARYFALHLRRRSVAGLSMADLAARTDRFAREHGLTPLIVAVGASHDDPGLARRFSPLLATRHILLDDPLDLREITAALAWSSMYLGASLHGYIAGAAYGVPGVLVARPAYRKFGGFLAHSGRRQDLARSWDAAFDLADRRAQEGRAQRIPATVQEALDAHWSRIREVLAGNPSRRARQALAAPLPGLADGTLDPLDALRSWIEATRGPHLQATKGTSPMRSTPCETRIEP